MSQLRLTVIIEMADLSPRELRQAFAKALRNSVLEAHLRGHPDISRRIPHSSLRLGDARGPRRGHARTNFWRDAIHPVHDPRDANREVGYRSCQGARASGAGRKGLFGFEFAARGADTRGSAARDFRSGTINSMIGQIGNLAGYALMGLGVGIILRHVFNLLSAASNS